MICYCNDPRISGSLAPIPHQRGEDGCVHAGEPATLVCDCGHLVVEHQTGDGPWTGFCYGDPEQECKCEAPTT